IDYPGKPIGEGFTHKDGLQDPVYYWDPVIAPSGLAFYTGTLFPEWKDSLFVGGLRSMALVRLKIVNDKVVEEEPLLAELRRRIRDVRVGPDGAVYVLTDSGGSAVKANTPPTSQLLKLTPKTAGQEGREYNSSSWTRWQSLRSSMSVPRIPPMR